MAHLVWYARGRGVDTVLAETVERSEVSQLAEWEDQPLALVWRKCLIHIRHQPDPAVWRVHGDQHNRREGLSEGESLLCQLF